MTKFRMWKKVTKSDLTIISKPHAHPHTMKKRKTKTSTTTKKKKKKKKKKKHAMFQNDRYKTVRGVAFTRHPELMLTDGQTDGRTETCRPKLPC